jgi:hypothetical protein
MALTSGPSQPEFTQFEPAGSSEMVNLFTGDFSYNIPLLDVEGYPINIAYSANPRMDQEASWVGLGWNINPGAVNRSLRGLPDDFKGDEIQRRVAMKDYTTYGGLTGFAMEIAGAGSGITGGLNMSIASGSAWNNYKGWGSEIATDLGLAANMQGQNGGGGLSAGIGMSFKASTFEGVEFAPYVGLKGSYSKAKNGSSGMGASIGVNYSPSINSRSGVWNQTWNMSVALQYAAPGASKSDGKGGTLYKGKGMGVGTNFSMTNLGSSTAFLPQIPFNTKSTAWSLDLKIGGGTCIFAAFGSIRGYYSNTTIPKNDKSYLGYGYLNEECANDENSILDFSREKDGVTYKESSNLPLTSHNFDMYSMSAQGMMGVFRSHRNDIGTVYDISNRSNSNNNAIGGEIAFGDGVNVGLNYIGTFSKENSGLWKSAMHSVSKFQNVSALTAGNFTDKEGYYHSFVGEKTIGDKTHKMLLGGENAVSADLIDQTKGNFQTSDYYKQMGSGYPVLGNSYAFNNTGIPNRKPRDRNISMLKASIAKNFAIEKKIKNYDLNTFSISNGNVYNNPTNEINRDGLLSSLSNIDTKIGEHISEISSTDVDGSRYIYGIPVYNYYSKDVTFSTNKDASNVDGNGYVTYTSANENNIGSPINGNGQGKEGFLEATIMPSYAHSYLLTSVLSSDYVDLTDNGPTTDDYGNYVKYNYSKSIDYGWRMPVSTSAMGATAVYNEGFYSDSKDNKASYSYGVKQNWYVHSIETKNFVAFFELSDRRDNQGVNPYLSPTLSPFSDESSTTNSGQKTKKLDKITLYNKQDIIAAGSVSAATPIKTVNFLYDYSLCPGVPNNDGAPETVTTLSGSSEINQAKGMGKLTLKKIWFSYGKSLTAKSYLSPYDFAYNDQIDHNFVDDGINTANPSYNPSCIDRWGNYKPQPPPITGLDNIKFPYVDQLETKTNRDIYSRAWCLNTIKTPSGGVIKVDYEADDYAYLNQKRAGQMFNLKGFAKTTAVTESVYMHNNVNDPFQYAVVDIGNMPSGYKDGSGNDINGIPGTFNTTDAVNYINKNYFNGLENRLFFKVKVRLTDQTTNPKYEFVPGYANIEGVVPIKTTGATNYDRLYIKLSTVKLGDKKHGSIKINPVARAALQMGRKYLQDIMYYDAVNDGTIPSPQQMILQMAGMIDDVLALMGGVNKKFIDRDFCREMKPEESFVRLINPNLKKIGGGNRVKKITVSDSWSDMISSESSHSYSQKYDYTVNDAETGNSISTGVANYEPLLGGDENSHRYPSTTPFSSNLSVNDELSIEHPIGETLVPDAIVGYSKVTVTNDYDTPSGKTVTKHGTGKTEYEFYTANDFPYLFEETDIYKQVVQPKKIAKLLKLKSKEKLYVTQGYVVKLNDMHGKAKAVLNYAEGQLGAISGIRYDYKRNGQELNNTVNVIDAKNVISTEEVGVDMDVINDSRQGKSKMQTFSISANIASFYCSYYIPLVFVWPGYSKLENQFYSLSTTKTVYKYGILDKVTAFDNGSVVETRDMLYDKESGQVVLTKTNNQYEDPVYNMTYPAHWSYTGMGPASKNSNLRIVHDGATTNTILASSTNTIASTVKSLLSPGDEIAVHNAVIVGGQFFENTPVGKYWVIEDLNPSATYPNAYYLIDKNGTKASFSTSNDYIFEVIRSGRRNLQNTPIAGMTSLVDPQNSPTNPTALNISASTKVLNTSAVEYDDKWNFNATHAEAREPVTTCTPIYNGAYNIFQKVFSCYLATPNHTYPLSLSSDGDKLVYVGSYTYTPKPVSYSGGFTLAEFNAYYGVGVSNLNPAFRDEPWVPTACASQPFQMVYFKIKWNSTKYQVYLYSEKWVYTCAGPEYIHYGSPYNQDGACVIDLVPDYTTHGAINSSDPTQVTSISGFGPAGSIYGNNQFSVTITASGGVSNSRTGNFIGTIPCGSILNGYNCNTTACANSSGNLNPYFQNMRGQWHPKRSYNYLEDRVQASVQPGGVMKGDIRDDGTYANYLPFWNYNSTSQKWDPVYKLSSQTTDPYGLYNKWVMNSEVNKMDHNGNVLQTQNTLRRPSSALYGYNFTRKTANAGNALYTDIAFDSFEDYDYVKDQCVEHFKFYDNKLSVTNSTSHTGKYSLMVPYNGSAKVKGAMNSNGSCNYVDDQNVVAYNSTTYNNYYNITADSYSPASSSGLYGIKTCDPTGRFGPIHSSSTAQTYLMSFWAKQDNPFGFYYTDYAFISGEFKLNGSVITGTVKKSPVIDGWQKFEYEFTIPASTSSSYLWEVNLKSAWFWNAYFDDFRIQPLKSSMVTSVYDPHSLRLWAELDERNFATLYEYDEEGALVRVKKETEKGISTVKEVRNGLFRRL